MSRTAKQHTENLINQLQEIHAPWHLSHELYWNYRENEPVKEYIEEATKPLLGTGRVPILITSLDPAKDREIIKEILKTTPSVVPGETILIRWSLNSSDSIKPAAEMIKSILKNCRDHKVMPIWWPLLQGDLNINQWKELQELLGEDWQYVNLAVNPFTNPELLNIFPSQITVAQFVLGSAEGIDESGKIRISSKVDLGNMPQERIYDIEEYAQRIQDSGLMPMSIICGPSLEEWSDDYNKERLQKFIPLFTKSTKFLWHGASPEGRKEILDLPA
jgi:hypothetical protein